MPIVITYKQAITAKNGDRYVIYRGLLDSGDTFEAFLTADKAAEYAIPDNAIVKPAQLKEAFDNWPVSGIQFNQRGRVESMSV